VSADAGPLLDRLEAKGADAVLPEPGDRAPDVAQVVRLISEAVAAPPGSDEELRAWDDAGGRHEPEILDELIEKVLPSGLFGRLSGARGRFRDSARRVVRLSERPGTLELAAALLGAAGDTSDVPCLEAMAVHPALALHASTALANVGNQSQAGRAALLRLLHTADGAARVLVIDRLFAFLWEPAVRIALVRDAVRGLDPEHARQVAGDIARICAVDTIVDDPDAPEEMREGARLLLELSEDETHSE